MPPPSTPADLPYDITVPNNYTLPATISWIVTDESSVTSNQTLATLTPCGNSSLWEPRFPPPSSIGGGFFGSSADSPGRGEEGDYPEELDNKDKDIAPSPKKSKVHPEERCQNVEVGTPPTSKDGIGGRGSPSHREPLPLGSRNVIKAPVLNSAATIKIIITNDSIITSPDTIIATISQLSCDHLVVVHGLCADCNEEVEISDTSLEIDDSICPGFITNESSLSISATFVKQMEESNLHSLLVKKMLCLVLDLDNTLIHAKVLLKGSAKTNEEYSVVQFGGRNNLYRLRPGVTDFLKRMSKYFQLYMFTMGTSEHASAALSLLDPEGTLFSNRVFSRSDSQNYRKALGRIFPNYQGIVCVVDDCEHAWHSSLHGAGFFKIHPYYYFHETSKQQNSLTAMITSAHSQSFYNNHSIGTDILYDKTTFSSKFLPETFNDNDKMLRILGDLLINFHKNFFKNLENIASINKMDIGVESFKKAGITLGMVVDQLRARILKGVKLLIDDKDFDTDFINSDYISWAKIFGAKVVSDEESATHRLVLNPKAERNSKIKDVHLMWLDKCLYTWIHTEGDETPYNPSLWERPYRNFWDIFNYPNKVKDN